MINGIIYIIVNKVNKKKYVGQTTIGLKRRYQMNWWKHSHNNYLRHSIEKYGIDNFEFEILESNIDSIELLNKLESKYAQELNTYIPNGYNITRCGNNKLMNEETKQKLSLIKSKTHVVKDLNGNLLTITNLSQFCKDKQLNRSALLNLIYGISNYSQGFVRPETDINTVKMSKVYTFISPWDEIITGNITGICKKYSLKKHTLYHLKNKQVKVSKGWRIIDNAP